MPTDRSKKPNPKTDLRSCRFLHKLTTCKHRMCHLPASVFTYIKRTVRTKAYGTYRMYLTTRASHTLHATPNDSFPTQRTSRMRASQTFPRFQREREEKEHTVCMEIHSIHSIRSPRFIVACVVRSTFHPIPFNTRVSHSRGR